ncbi:gamma-glutamylcyclotransferase family protein [Hydrogenimonas sp.]
MAQCKKGRRHYFAYGSNMYPAQMALRCPDAQIASVGVLYGYEFIINEWGVATVVKNENFLTLGLIWEISSNDENMLDLYEGVAGNYYRKSKAEIESVGGNKRFECLVYLASNNTRGVPREDYLSGIIEAAETARFPSAYLTVLKRWRESVI